MLNWNNVLTYVKSMLSLPGGYLEKTDQELKDWIILKSIPEFSKWYPDDEYTAVVVDNEYYKGNTKFFSDYITNIENNPIALRQIYEGLLNFDIKAIIPSGNFQQDKPQTKIEDEVKKYNREKILYFIEELIKENNNDDDDDDDVFDKYEDKVKATPKKKNIKNNNIIKYSNKELYIKWTEWCKIQGLKSEMNNIQFGLKMSNIMKKNINKKTICITKDLKHSTTTFFIHELTEFYNKLNSCDFIDDTINDTNNNTNEIK